MILLASTSDKIQVITTAAGKIDVYAAFMDYDSTASPTVSGGRRNFAITTATTTDVVPSPAAATTLRNLKNLKISNNHATITNTVTVQHTDGTTVIQLEQLTLLPGERMAIDENGHIRAFDSLGREKVQGNALSTGNANTADVTANAADTYLTGGSLNISGRVQAASFFKWRFRLTKTAAGVAAPTFNIRTGTAGAVGDASRVLFTGAAQTAVVDTAMIEMDAILRSVGATAVLSAVIRMDHTSADAAGLGTLRYLLTTSASFDITPANTVIGVSCNPGAAGVWTFQNISIEANNLLS